jgi:hypothetical protein
MYQNIKNKLDILEYMRKYCDDDRIDLGILMNLHILIRLNTKKWFWYAVCLHVFILMYAWLCASVAANRPNGFYSYSAFASLLVTRLCPVNLNIAAPTIVTLDRRPQA